MKETLNSKVHKIDLESSISGGQASNRQIMFIKNESISFPICNFAAH